MLMDLNECSHDFSDIFVFLTPFHKHHIWVLYELIWHGLLDYQEKKIFIHMLSVAVHGCLCPSMAACVCPWLSLINVTFLRVLLGQIVRENQDCPWVWIARIAWFWTPAQGNAINTGRNPFAVAPMVMVWHTL